MDLQCPKKECIEVGGGLIKYLVFMYSIYYIFLPKNAIIYGYFFLEISLSHQF